MFRLPFRTEATAPLSDICGKIIQPADMSQLLDTLHENAVDLVLFTKNIKSVKVYTIDSNGELALKTHAQVASQA